MKKVCVSIVLVALYISLVSCRPQNVQIEKQDLLHVHTARSGPEKRGSDEETRRILQEINRINIAMGYIRPNEFSFPRVATGDGYFYPRQQFRPEFLTKPKKNQHNSKLNRAINPFSAQYYYYPTPYLQVPNPNNGKQMKFKASKLYYPLVYAPYNLVSMPYKEIKANDSSKLGQIVVLPDSERSPKAISENTIAPPAVDAGKKNQVGSSKIKPQKPEKNSEEEDEEENADSIIEDIVRVFVPEAADIADEIADEDERQEPKKPTTTRFPPLKNDKFLNLALNDPKEGDDDDDTVESRNFPVPNTPINNTRAISFQNSIERIQNLTKSFTINRGDKPQIKSEEITSTSESPEDEIKEEEKEEALDEFEESKSPFGFVWGPKQQLQTFKEGGLIIQRLRVRHGGIAIAGPGGVATAGSGGTAIVGPNGIALTHPRGLAIGGPGARIYSVPESTDLEQLALTHKARKLEDLGVLVARGPAIFYNKEDIFEQVDDSVRLPYLGGAKGQILEIRQRPDGTIFSRILTDDVQKDQETEDFLAQKTQDNSFEVNLLKIQEAAAELVRIQEIFKLQGRLTTEQRKVYSQSLEKLGVSAQKLSKIEGTDDNVRLLLEETHGDRIKNKEQKKKPENIQFPPYHKLNKKDEDCDEGAVVEEGDADSSSTTSTSTTEKTSTSTSSSPLESTSTSSVSTSSKKPSIAVIQSSNTATVGGQSNDEEDEESSVAEAKPVGLAIAGVGGVASSKPVGTAVVGPGGLAVARPVATAVAGIKPSEFSALGLPLPAKIKNISARDSASLPSKGKYGLVNFGTEDDHAQFLVGPEFLSEARLSDKGIESNEDDELDGDEKNTGIEDTKRVSFEAQRRPVNIEKEKEDFNELDSNRQTELAESLTFPFGIEYGKHPLFPPAYDNFFNYPSPYFLPPSTYMPVPIMNQYLQRRASNAVFRYPSLVSQYPGYSNTPLPISPFRVFYSQ